MAPALVAVVALAAVVGLTLGLLGGGGSILLVPLLTYVGGLDAREAIATSLIVVGTTSAVSMLGHARRGNVRWRTGLLVGAAGAVGAFAGGVAGGHVPAGALMVGFALMMIATAGAMIRGRRAPGAPCDGPGARTPAVRILLLGALVGAVTGLVGAGGGFLVVPALALLAGLPMTAAVGTSLLVIALNTVAGLAGHLTTMSPDWALVGAVTAAAVLGSLVGVRLTTRVPESTLRRGFGYVVLAMGVAVLAGELPSPAGPVVLTVAGVAGLAAVASRWSPRMCR